MIKFFILMLFPFFLYANLTYTSNYAKEVAILDAFDIDPSFINDPMMNEMKNSDTTIYNEERFFQAMDDGYFFVPAIKNILTKHNIPPEFLFLSMAESHFLVRAYSATSASGLWQFMPQTGKLYGLKIDQYVDERRDLIKSTEAAAKYLNALHKQFGKWYLVAIAYNCGGGKLSRAIEEAGSDDLSVLLDPEKKYIPRESRLHIRKIIALAMLGNDEEFLLKSEYEHLLNRANAYSIATVKLPSGESLERVAKLIEMPLEDLQKLNKHLMYGVIPPYIKEYDIHIPYVKLSDFKQKYFEDSIKKIHTIHIVKAGETLSKVAAKYGVTSNIIKDFNNLKSTKLSSKQSLIIPSIVLPKTQKMLSSSIYTVKKGDTLASISKEHRIDIQDLKTRNKMKSDFLKEGEKIKLYE
ncbi:MAG: rane-bound lytic murein transglycosylase [Campylobacterota bacterium]|nr:rane-bound lytic murein transglycosylase [Campylobacterota bacterium]